MRTSREYISSLFLQVVLKRKQTGIGHLVPDWDSLFLHECSWPGCLRCTVKMQTVHSAVGRTTTRINGSDIVIRRFPGIVSHPEQYISHHKKLRIIGMPYAAAHLAPPICWEP